MDPSGDVVCGVAVLRQVLMVHQTIYFLGRHLRGFHAFLVRTPVREALGAWSVTRSDLHSSQTMPSRIVVVLLVRLHHVETIGRTFSHVSHHARGKRSSLI